jgi:uncharacterized protein (TIGR02328 family)
MRLWHQKLIPYIPRQQLLGQHRECCALRGRGWGRKHKRVNYVFKYSPARLFLYHLLVMQEMLNRGYKPAKEWFDSSYRGKNCQPYSTEIEEEVNELKKELDGRTIYPEHSAEYIRECTDNLLAKGVNINYF